MKTSVFFILLIICLNRLSAQNHAPEVTNVTFTQRTDGSFVVDVYYDLNDTDGNAMTVTMQVSDDNGATWDFSCANVSGDIGSGKTSGAAKHIEWDFGAEHPQTFGDQFRIKITADDGVQGNTVTDVDGNVYKTVKIGDQWWMAENLKVTQYNDRTPINHVTGNSAWTSTSGGAYCSYDNNDANIATYGLLYNWYAVDTKKLAPAGWHVPSDAEWKQLEMYLGMTQSQANATGWRGTDQGYQMKSTSGWNSNGNGSNSSGFSALPGGFRYYYNGAFYHVGSSGFWWSATVYSSVSAWYRELRYSDSGVYRNGDGKQDGFSVRCVRD